MSEEQYKAGKNVTFQEFIDYVIRTYRFFGVNALDPHWQTMSNLCNPCMMKYNFIGKMETLVGDSEEILMQIGWNDKVKFPNATDKYKVPISHIVKEHYGKLSGNAISKLYEIYKEDFLIFGYPMDEY